MKKKLICIILSTSMILAFTACSNTSNTNTTSSEIEMQADKSDDNQEVSEIVEVAVDSENATDTKDGTDYSTGNPWINSDYLQNVIDYSEVSLKDHFAMYQNKEWVLNHPIKDGTRANSNLTSFEDELNSRLLSIATDESDSGNHDAQIIQSFYKSFLDWDEREATSLDAIMPYIERIEAIKSYDDYIEYCKSDEMTLSDIINFSIAPNPEDSQVNIIYICGIDIFLNDAADYEDLEHMSDYTKLTYDCEKKKVSTVLSYCGYSKEDIDSIFDGAIKYEQLITRYSYTNDEAYLTETLTKVYQQIVNEDDIKDYKWYVPFKASLQSIGLTGEIPSYLLFEKMDYFENLDSFISEENIEIIKDYMLAHTASEAIGYLNKDCYYAKLDINNELNGSSGYKDEYKYALQLTGDYLGWPLSKLYCDKYVTKEDKENVYNLIIEIVDAYKTMLKSEDFLSEETKKEAMNKLSHLRIKCMYPDNWDDFDYTNLTLSNNYFDNIMAIQSFHLNQEVNDFYKPKNKDKWDCTPITINAFYSSVDNSINILPGLIGDVLYNNDMPQEEVYAKLGSVIGHEISHAFDPNGSTYDAYGNKKNWWTEDDYANFNQRTNKLVQYYDKIKIWDDFNCNGELIKTEACADMAGVSAVLQIANNKKDFDYDLFFKSYANAWASNMTPEFMYYIGSYDSHPLNYLRINVTVAQFDEFYNTYDIKEGDGMYIAPEDRVKIW